MNLALQKQILHLIYNWNIVSSIICLFSLSLTSSFHDLQNKAKLTWNPSFTGNSKNKAQKRRKVMLNKYTVNLCIQVFLHHVCN